MLYFDKITGDVKTRSKIEEIHNEIISSADDPEAYKDIEDIEDFIKKYFIELDGERDQSIIESKLHIIEDYENQIQELEKDNQRQLSVREKEIEKLKKEIEECEKEIEGIIERYPFGYFDFVFARFGYE